jgi:uncharacterized membrane protein
MALSVMGIADALYHAYGELTFTLNSCNLSATLSCTSVFNSGYTTFPPAGMVPGLPVGISFWVYGVVWFPLCLVYGVWVIRRHVSPAGSVMAPFLMIGNIFTLYPWFIEIRLLNGHYCPVCISLYVINYVLTFVALASRSRSSEN